ncbi:bifunctional ADP-dependent NAD(P)H-hydrate dehydratase/NAD(P)H-hydrate epimerase [Geopsychrobacter electrodiphilus]|uniref:bifunctional ADP-dependent NAD(P)H-hydrate dehydratase/NAD(P)H-hydrate epimerase n=1 Tax=Geopsychrobacter electrodiphilus TaxID=225196 RepID=UPI00037244AA|nr:bifunctional ADP-dependent NAD(P)H-hydrate dehydratase/NAD(P)H-hydrate epimerase [Geopsychrobacter electrodiphilus]
MKLVTAEQMQAIDRNAIESLRIPGAALMENAGRAAAAVIQHQYSDIFPGPLLVMAGSGNNGGDGYVIARILADAGWQVRTLVLAEQHRISGDAALMLQILQNLEADVRFLSEAVSLQVEFTESEPILIVDALLGTGLSAEVTGLYRTAIDLINQSSSKVVAIDIPSGVQGSDGRIMGCAVRADLTLAFDSGKIGLASRPGADFVGDLRILEIGIPRLKRPKFDFCCDLVDAITAAKLIPSRQSTGHKGSFGHLGVVAGSAGMTGSAALSSEAGLRSGAGLVTLACPGGLHDIFEIKLTEVMTRPLALQRKFLHTENIQEIFALAAAGWQALVLGPGLGNNQETVSAIRQLVTESTLPMVLDADGLNAFAGVVELLRTRTSYPLVLTPHPGEFSRLIGMPIAAIEADRFRLARQFAIDHQVVLLLKGARTLIADPAGQVRINTSGNAGLASAGSGDVLSGLIGGLLAQGLTAFDAASLGAWLHGAAADHLAAEFGCAGILAGDLLKAVPVARYQLEGACLC